MQARPASLDSIAGGNILERKRPAARSVGIDVDPEVIEVWRQLDVPGLELHHGDAVAWLESHPFTGTEFVYVDPPYVMDSRRGGKLYRHEYDDADHVRLLDVLAGLPCAVMVSGYSCRFQKTNTQNVRSQFHLTGHGVGQKSSSGASKKRPNNYGVVRSLGSRISAGYPAVISG